MRHITTTLILILLPFLVLAGNVYGNTHGLPYLGWVLILGQLTFVLWYWRDLHRMRHERERQDALFLATLENMESVAMSEEMDEEEKHAALLYLLEQYKAGIPTSA